MPKQDDTPSTNGSTRRIAAVPSARGSDSLDPAQVDEIVAAIADGDLKVGGGALWSIDTVEGKQSTAGSRTYQYAKAVQGREGAIPAGTKLRGHRFVDPDTGDADAAKQGKPTAWRLAWTLVRDEG